MPEKGAGVLMKICLMEMDDRTRQSMVLVLSHRADGAIVLADAETADIAVLDLDHPNALESYQSTLVRRPSLRAIGLASRPEQGHDGVLMLRKPVSANRLLEAIQQLGGRETIGAKVMAAGAAAALWDRTGSARRRPVTTAVPTQEKPTFDLNAYLLGTLVDASAEAGKRDQVAVVSFYGDRVILLDSKAGVVHTNLSTAQARAFSTSSVEGEASTDKPNTVGLQRPRVEFVTRAEAAARYRAKTFSVPQEIFMWTLGSMTSRGRLPDNIDPDERVYLRRWPNMTRFSYSDTDMRIIAYWVGQATSLQEIADALGVLEGAVFNVYTAAYAAGLAGKARREADGIWEAPQVAAHSERGLFSSIMRRLLQRKPACNEEEQVAAA
jgi:hypothetical protein